jgi:Glycosyl hydrolases family 15
MSTDLTFATGGFPQEMHPALRFDYGVTVPWVTRLEDGSGVRAIAGANQVVPAALSPRLPPHNWDYRYCWLRDATFTLMALVSAGYRDEAQAWGQWLRRSVAGSPHQLQNAAPALSPTAAWRNLAPPGGFPA